MGTGVEKNLFQFAATRLENRVLGKRKQLSLVVPSKYVIPERLGTIFSRTGR